MRLAKGTLLAAGAVAIAAGAALAAEPDAAIKYRQNIMKAQGGHISAVAAILKGEIEQTEALAPHARGLYLSATTALEAFRQNTDGQGSVETDAEASIWSNWSDFESKANDLVEATRRLAEAAEAGDASGEHLQAVGQACKACHDEHRSD